MKSAPRSSINLAASGNLAFVIVVGAAYVSAITALISARRALPPLEIGLLLAVGSAYLLVGTYGFALCRRLTFTGCSANRAMLSLMS